jgi:DNA-directed RNA polymerase-3 subunit RPC5
LQKKDQERSAQRHRNSYAYKRASEEGEDWISLDVHGNARDGRWTGVKKEIMERVKCTHRERELSLSCTMKSNEGYVRSLNYLDSGAISFGVEEDLSEWAPSEYNAREPDKDDASVSSAVGPLERAAAELAAKLAVLLQNGNGTMIPYAVIRSRLNAAVSDEVLTMALSSCAVLVRGNFCLKSSLAQFLNVGGSGNNRGRDMRELRDLILLLLNMYGMVQRERLVRVYARDEEDAIINPESITFLLQTVAKRSDGNNCWVAKVQDDDTFAANFPEVAAFHGVYWVKKKERLKKLVVAYESATDE